jgi:hypothetical protein
MIEFQTEGNHTEIWYDASETCKYLNIKYDDKILGRNRFIELLRFNGYVMRDSNQPKQSPITMGLMRFHMVNRKMKKYGMLLFSERGLNYLKRKIETGDIQIGFQKKAKKNHYVTLAEVLNREKKMNEFIDTMNEMFK